MSEWKETVVGEYADVLSGYAFKSEDFSDRGTPVLKIKNVASGSLKMDDVQYYPFEVTDRLKKFLVKKSDILIAMTGSHVTQPSSMVGKVCRYNLDYDSLLNQRVGKIFSKDKEQLNEDFIYYFFKQNDITTELASSAGGSANQANISPDQIKGLPILLPPIEEQRIIATIFTSIDGKIDLLSGQISTSEQLAETLFRQWFIEEATTEEEVTLDEFVNTVNGYSYKSSELNPSENALVTLKSFNRNGSFRLDGFKEFTGTIKQHQTVQQGDLIVSHTDITQEAEVIGNPALVIEDPRYKHLVITMDMVKVVPKDDRLSIPFLYFLMRTPEFKFHCLGCSNGTTVLHMSKSAIPTFSFPKPDYEKVKTFTEYAGNLLEKTFKNHAQIRSLNNFRDTILPKLMSGEATIKE